MSHGGSDPRARAVFEILVREHAPMLEAYLRSLLGADPGVDDVFQETLLVAWRRLDDYDRTRPLAAWLRGIAHMLVLEHSRKRRRRPLSTDPQVLAEIDHRYDALDRAAGDTFVERTERLDSCLAKLPEQMREAIDLIYTRSLPIAAAAASIGVSEEALKKRVQRARGLLAVCLGIGGSEHR